MKTLVTGKETTIKDFAKYTGLKACLFSEIKDQVNEKPKETDYPLWCVVVE